MIELILGVGVFCMVLVYIASQISDKDHFILRLLFFSLAILALILVGKATIDSKQICESVINSTTENTSIANITSITHTHGVHCYDVTNSTSSRTFYRFTTLIFVLFMAYVMYYFIYWVFGRITKWLRRGRR